MLGLFAAAVNAIPTVFNWLLAVAVFVCIPLVCFRRTRKIAGGLFTALTILLWPMFWASMAVVTYLYFGLSGLIFGIILGGVGVFFLGVVATLARGSSDEIIGMIVMAAAALGTAYASAAVDQALS